MNITRRQFLQYCTASAAVLGLSQIDLLKLEKALADVSPCGCHGAPHVIWFQGQSCGGCTLSVLNRMANPADPVKIDAAGTLSYGAVVQDTVDLLVGDAVGALALGGERDGWATFPDGYICLDYQAYLIAGAGDLIAQYIEDVRNSGEPYFVGLSGAIPMVDHFMLEPNNWQPACVSGSFNTGDGRKERSIGQILEWLATGAGFSGLVAFGTCASYGGIPGSKGSPTAATGAYNYLVNYRGLGDVTTGPGSVWQLWHGIDVKLKDGIINCPGCAPHPDWMMFPIAYILVNQAVPPLNTGLVQTPVWLGNSPVNPSDNWVPVNRPSAIYGSSIYGATKTAGYDHFCEVCPKYSLTNTCSNLGAGPGNGDGSNPKEYCTRPSGCNGFIAVPDCPTRSWNVFDGGGLNQWCVGNLPSGPNYVCQGCAEHDFPDGRSPFFSAIKDGK